MPIIPSFFHPLKLHKHVTAFSTQREGGASNGAYESFNITPYTGDDPEKIEINRQKLAAYLNIPATHIVLPYQSHTTNVRIITNPPSNEELENVDAIITQTSQLCIGVSTADCIPILLYDPKNHAIAAIHAGWRGTHGNIATRTIHMMQEHCGTQPQNLYAAIGPGISLQAYEVGDELPKAFAEAGFPLERIAKRINGRWHLDLPEANRIELLRNGIAENHIINSQLCTYTLHHRFFSARRLGIHSGRIYTALMLND